MSGLFRFLTAYTMKIDLGMKAKYLYLSMILKFFFCTLTFTNQT